MYNRYRFLVCFSLILLLLVVLFYLFIYFSTYYCGVILWIIICRSTQQQYYYIHLKLEKPLCLSKATQTTEKLTNRENIYKPTCVYKRNEKNNFKDLIFF